MNDWIRVRFILTILRMLFIKVCSLIYVNLVIKVIWDRHKCQLGLTSWVSSTFLVVMITFSDVMITFLLVRVYYMRFITSFRVILTFE